MSQSPYKINKYQPQSQDENKYTVDQDNILLSINKNSPQQNNQSNKKLINTNLTSTKKTKTQNELFQFEEEDQDQEQDEDEEQFSNNFNKNSNQKEEEVCLTEHDQEEKNTYNQIQNQIKNKILDQKKQDQGIQQANVKLNFQQLQQNETQQNTQQDINSGRALNQNQQLSKRPIKSSSSKQQSKSNSKFTSRRNSQDEIIDQPQTNQVKIKRGKTARQSVLQSQAQGAQGLAQKGVGLAFIKAKQMALDNKLKRILTSYYHDTQSYRKKIFSLNHFNMVNDKSREETYRNQTLSIQDRIQKLMRKFGFIEKLFLFIFNFKPLHPNHKIVSLLQVWESLFIIILFFTYTWYIFFDFNNIPFQIIENSIGLGIFSFSLLVRINTAFFQGGFLIQDRIKILNHKKKYFIYDACAFWALIYNISNVDSENFIDKLLVFPIFAKTATLMDSIEGIVERLNFTGNLVYLYELVKLLAQAIILCHFIGTLYYILAEFELHVMEDENNWVSLYEIRETEWYNKYMQSFYWAQATIMLVGSKGETFIETTFCCLTLLITVGFFALILSSINNILEDIVKKTKGYSDNQEIINSFFNSQNPEKNIDMPADLQGRMLNYLKFEYIGHRDQKENMQFEELIERFPENLRDAVNQTRFAQKIKSIDFLVNNFSEETIEQLVNHVEQEFYMPNEYIYEQKEYVEPKIYLILKGEVQICQNYENLTSSTLYTLGQGDYFGEQEFFSNVAPIYSAKSTSFVTILTIPRSNFINIVRSKADQGKDNYDYDNFPMNDDFENYHMVKDQILLSGLSDYLKRNCKICNSSSHSEKTCNLVYFSPNLHSLKARSVYSKDTIDRTSLPIEYKYFDNEALKHKIKTIQRKSKQQFNSVGHAVNQNLIERLYECQEDIMHEAKLRIYLKEIQEQLKEYELKHPEEFLNPTSDSQSEAMSESYDGSSSYFDDEEQQSISIIQEEVMKTSQNFQTLEEEHPPQNPKMSMSKSKNQFQKKNIPKIQISQLESQIRVSNPEQFNQSPNNQLTAHNTQPDDIITEPKIQTMQITKDTSQKSDLEQLKQLQQMQDNKIQQQQQQEYIKQIEQSVKDQVENNDSFFISRNKSKPTSSRLIQLQEQQQMDNSRQSRQSRSEKKSQSKNPEIQQQVIIGQLINQLQSMFSGQTLAQQVSNCNSPRTNRRQSTRKVTYMNKRSQFIQASKNTRSSNMPDEQKKDVQSIQSLSQFPQISPQARLQPLTPGSVSNSALVKQVPKSSFNPIEPNFYTRHGGINTNNSLLEEQDEHDEDDIFCMCPDCRFKDSFFWDFESLRKYLKYFPFNNWNHCKIKFFKMYEKQQEKLKLEEKRKKKLIKKQTQSKVNGAQGLVKRMSKQKIFNKVNAQQSPAGTATPNQVSQTKI